ncbi:MAG TPA: acyl carrier protein [Planctomycetes bacterium]|nr:acyl carrier protein [Planctomycetota bacterium]HIK59639.1 acyl carrier protein [Planctomycetota bacterium]
MSDTLQTVGRMIQEVIGDDWDLDQAITTETSFGDDLELESIEFVSLAEALKEEYGAEVDFVGWLSTKELDEIIKLKVGDVVEFIDLCRSSN